MHESASVHPPRVKKGTPALKVPLGTHNARRRTTAADGVRRVPNDASERQAGVLNAECRLPLLGEGKYGNSGRSSSKI